MSGPKHSTGLQLLQAMWGEGGASQNLAWGKGGFGGKEAGSVSACSKHFLAGSRGEFICISAEQHDAELLQPNLTVSTNLNADTRHMLDEHFRCVARCEFRTDVS